MKYSRHAQTFTEVRGDRALDDLTGGLGHEAAHAGELLDLRAVASGTGVHHDVERVVMLLALVVFKVRKELVGDLSPTWVQMSMIFW
jgi:hypothetical protein